MLDELKDKINKAAPFLPLKVTAMCIYGSYARAVATKDSDLDLLVIANNIAKRRIDRTQDIIKIKDAMALKIPADILLLTEDECIDNFRNHNPLFLDITIEGVIVFDSKGFLKNLIKETGDYIRTKPVIKETWGWRFPVRQRAATLMSEKSNRDWTLIWLNDGKRDVKLAQIAMENGLYEKSVSHSQQGVEKAIKAVLLCWGNYPKSHFVSEILLDEMNNNETEEWHVQLEELAGYAKELEPHVSLSRYPDMREGIFWIPYEGYTKEITNRFLEFAKKALSIAEGYLNWWFKE